MQATETIGQWLDKLATSQESQEKDNSMMEHLLHKVGFQEAKCIYGIVYLDGRRTIEAPPMSIHTMAGMLINKARRTTP